MAARKQSEINLLPQKGFEATTTGRVLAWVLSTFRVIVIVTEMIVMIAFLSRFWLDAQNSDLNEEIDEKQALLSASVTFENQFRDIQKRLSLFSQLTVQKALFSTSVKTITSYLPDDLYLTGIIFNNNAFLVEGATSNEQSIQQLIVNLASSGIFPEVGLVEVRTTISNPDVLLFKIDARTKPKAVAQEVTEQVSTEAQQ